MSRANLAMSRVQPTFNYGYRRNQALVSRGTMIDPQDVMQQADRIDELIDVGISG